MKKRTFIFFSFLIAGSLFFTYSCNQQKKQHSEIQINCRFFPFYRDFAAIDTQHISAGLQQLKTKYPDFLDFYLDTLIQLHVNGQYSDNNRMLYSYLVYKDYRNLFDTVNKAFPDTRQQDREIRKALQNLKYYDTAFIIPSRIFYFVSALRLSAITHNDTDLGIGLDMFLGRSFAPYASIGIPDYATIRFTRENIPVWACRTIYENRFPFEPDNKNLLEMMLERGKEIYYLKKILPDIPENLLLGYTPEQMKWCNDNEAAIYNFFIQNNLLYEHNLQQIVRYVMDGPSTAGFSGDSPGNLGSFTGWKIIEQFAAHKHLDMETVLTTRNAQQILQEARYKP